MGLLLNVSFAIFAGLMMTRVVRSLKLPDVTSYLIAGLLIGPYCLGKLNFHGIGFNTVEQVETLSLVSKVALGFIAFQIGAEFKLEELKHTGKAAAVIGVAQALAACAVVDVCLMVMHFIAPEVVSVPVAITLGAIATATAPAATLMIIKQYHADGETTKLLLPIVALDDAVGLIVFAISFGVAKAISSGIVDIYSIVVSPLLEIVLSLGGGLICGWIMDNVENMFHNKNNRVAMIVAFIFASVALSMKEFEIGPVSFSISSLLFCMMLSATFVNLYKDCDYVLRKNDNWVSVLLIVFFVVSGAELDLTIFKQPIVILTGVVYILTRCVGKYAGAYFSAKAMGCSKETTNNLGITLFPQAGVALGMCVTAQQLGGAEGTVIRNIVLFGVLVYELFGPSLTKWALTNTGDIKKSA